MLNRNISFGGTFLLVSLIAGTGLVADLASGPLPHPVEPSLQPLAAAQTAKYQPAAGEPSTPARRARNETLADATFDDLTSQTCPRCR